jgi:hypothetical protein
MTGRLAETVGLEVDREWHVTMLIQPDDSPASVTGDNRVVEFSQLDPRTFSVIRRSAVVRIKDSSSINLRM